MRLTAKINLMELKASLRNMNGVSGPMECIIIPIVVNKLFKGEKGIYLDIVGFEITKPIEGSKDTHILKQSLSKEQREDMSEDEIRAMPILGNLRMWDASGSEPQSSMETGKETDDLPF